VKAKIAAPAQAMQIGDRCPGNSDPDSGSAILVKTRNIAKHPTDSSYEKLPDSCENSIVEVTK
jgi:hypothetical protein